VATVAVSQDFVSLVAEEIARSVDNAVESWMAQVEHALTDGRLTTLGRLNAAKEVMSRYKELTGKTELNLIVRKARASERI